MPFGFEEMDYRDEYEYDNFGKCVEVIAVTKRDGRTIPKAFSWDDELIVIDKVAEMRPANSRKDNHPGWWYRCKVRNKVLELYYDIRDGKWYVNL